MMFFVGLKIDLKDFERASKRSIIISSLSVLVPFLLGFGSTMLFYYAGLLHGIIDAGSNIYFVAFFVGMSISLTAETVAIEILEELNLLRTIVGETIIEAAIIDDIIGILLVTGLIAISPSTGAQISFTYSFGLKAIEMVIFILIVYFIARFIVPGVMKMVEKERSKVDFFAVTILIAMFLAIVSQYLDLGGSILGALFSGIVVRATLIKGDLFERKEEKDITSIIEQTTFGLLAPFFFIWVGLNMNVNILVISPLFAIFLVFVALLGKIIGAIFGNRLNHGTAEEGWIIGWGMNARFDVELLIAAIVLGHGLITQNLFSTIVFVSFACTFISTIAFKFYVKKHHGL
jgi:Kef-type K+ transport system membrane component KefB